MAIEIGIIAGYLLARYEFDLRPASLANRRHWNRGRVRTGAGDPAGARTGWRRLAVIALCALMALFYVLALVVPFLRSFYELLTRNAGKLAAWAVGTAPGIGGMLTSVRVLRVC